MKHSKKIKAAALVACLGLVAAACGDDDEDSGAAATEAPAEESSAPAEESSAPEESSAAPETTVAEESSAAPETTVAEESSRRIVGWRRGGLPGQRRDPDRLVARARARRQLPPDRPRRHRRCKDTFTYSGPIQPQYAVGGVETVEIRAGGDAVSFNARVVAADDRRRHHVRLHQHERRHQGLGVPRRRSPSPRRSTPTRRC